MQQKDGESDRQKQADIKCYFSNDVVAIETISYSTGASCRFFKGQLIGGGLQSRKSFIGWKVRGKSHSVVSNFTSNFLFFPVFILLTLMKSKRIFSILHKKNTFKIWHRHLCFEVKYFVPYYCIIVVFVICCKLTIYKIAVVLHLYTMGRFFCLPLSWQCNCIIKIISLLSILFPIPGLKVSNPGPLAPEARIIPLAQWAHRLLEVRKFEEEKQT